MSVVPVVNVRDTFEPAGESLPHLIFADETLPTGFRSPWEIKGALIREVCHDRIEIMSIERLPLCASPAKRGCEEYRPHDIHSILRLVDNS
jgi:hypothetical protein